MRTGEKKTMQSETTYSGILGKLQRFQMAILAIIGEVLHLEPSRAPFVQVWSRAQDRVRPQAAIASKPEPAYGPAEGIRNGIVSSDAETPRRAALRNVLVTRLGASLRTVGGKAEDRDCTNDVLNASPTSSLRKSANAP
jgi:hypothetical protein